MKIQYTSLDSKILEAIAELPLRLDNVLAVAAVRDEALKINRRRAGVSPSESADIMINERLQALRHSRRIVYDPATGRWEILPNA